MSAFLITAFRSDIFRLQREVSVRLSWGLKALRTYLELAVVDEQPGSSRVCEKQSCLFNELDPYS